MNLYAKAYWSNNPIPVNQQINNPDFIINVPIGVIVGSSDVTKSYVDQQDAALSAQIDTKLDASDYVQHFRGVFVSLAALQAAIPAGINGDYAHIDLGVGFDRKVAIWDTDDNKWIESTGSVALTTDEVTEGNANKYFTDLRVRNTVLSGLVKTNSSNVTNTDTIEVAVGKLAAKSEAGGTITWVDANTLTGYSRYVYLDASLTKVQFAKINGLIWMRGHITIYPSANANSALLQYTDSRFLWDNTYQGSITDNQGTYDTVMHNNIKLLHGGSEFRLLARQAGTGTAGNITNTVRIITTVSITSNITYAIIEPVCLGIAKNP